MNRTSWWQESLVAFLAFAHVSTAATAQQVRWFDVIPEMRVDGYTHDLVPIDRIAVSARGTIAIAQGQDFAVRLFDTLGKHVGTVGKKGKGPGEFESIAGLGWFADSLWVYDNRLRRFTIFMSDGRVRRTVAVSASSTTLVTPMVLYPGGSVLAHLGGPLSRENRPSIWAKVRIGQTTGLVISALSPNEHKVEVDTKRGHAEVGLPFRGNRFREYSSDGSRIAIVTAFVEGSQRGVFQVVTLNANGDTLYSRNHRFNLTALPKSVGDSIIDRQYAGLLQRNPELAAEYKKRVRLPQFYPPIRSVTSGNDGTLAVALRTQSQEVQHLLLDSRGEYRGHVTLPITQFIAGISSNHIWVLETDQYDVQSVSRLRLRPR